MALNIPQNRQSAPEQNAIDGINPARQFGGAVAAPMNMPNVPQGMGGFTADRSGEIQGMQRLGNAIGGIVDDIHKKDRALRKANETLAFAEAGQAHQQEWLDKQMAIKKMLYAGEIDAEGAKQRAKQDIADLNIKHFGPDRFQDEEIQLHAKIQSLEISNKYDSAFKKDVIVPYQTSKYVDRMDGVTTNAVQTTSDSGRVGTLEDAMRSYELGRNTIMNTYGSVDANMLLDPERLVKDREKKVRDNGRAVIDGILARDYIPVGDAKYDPVKGAYAKLSAIGDAQKLLASNPQLRVDIGVDADNILKRLEDMKSRQLEFIQRQQDLQEKRAERIQKQQEKNAYAAIYADLVKNGIDSRYMNEETIIRSGVDPMAMSHLIEKKRGIEKGELNFDQSYRYVEQQARNGFSMARPDKQSAEYLDNHYSVVTRSPEFRNQTPEQQSQQIAQTYGAVGWLPERLKTDLSKALRSSNPAVVNGGVLQIQKLEQANPALLSALDANDRAFYANRRDGMPSERAVQLRDGALYKTPEQKKLDDHTYMSAIGAKKDNEIYDKNKSDFESRAKQNNSFFEFGTPRIPKGMIDNFNERVREYAPLTGFDMKRARELAYQETAANAGVSRINGARTFMVNAPENVYRGVKPERIQKQFESAIDELKKVVPDLKNKNVEDFGLVQDATYKSSSPRWQITVDDGAGNFIPVSAYTTSLPAYAKQPPYFRYDPTADIAEHEANQAKAINKAEAERDSAVNEQIAIEAKRKAAVAKVEDKKNAAPSAIDTSFNGLAKPRKGSVLNQISPNNAR